MICVLLVSGPIRPPEIHPRDTGEETENAAHSGTLKVRVVAAETGAPVRARFRLTGPQGHVAPLPEEAIAVMYGRQDRAQGYGYQPDSSFYAEGGFTLETAPGPYQLTVQKGNEFLRDTLRLEVSAGARTDTTLRLERWIDMPERGWYSADDHIHIRRSPRLDPPILDWVAAEDIHVGILLWMGDFWRTYYAQYAFGREGVFREGSYLITSGQEEPRTPEIGHTLGLVGEDRVRNADSYYLYDEVFDRLRELGGLAGYAHQAETFHGHRGLTLDGLRGKVDVLEILQFCAEEGPLAVRHYYHLLNLGVPVTATAGSDFPWCGKGHRYGVENAPVDPARIGNVRFYTHVGSTFSYERWREALKAGKTFVSSGPVLDLRVEGRRPGAHLRIGADESVRIRIEARGHPDQVPLSRLELVGHGRVLVHAGPDQRNQSPSTLTVDTTLSPDEGIWLAARTWGRRLQVAHTTPVYVHVEEKGFHNPDSARVLLDRSASYLDEIDSVSAHPNPDPGHHAHRYREGLVRRIETTRAVIDSLRSVLD